MTRTLEDQWAVARMKWADTQMRANYLVYEIEKMAKLALASQENAAEGRLFECGGAAIGVMYVEEATKQAADAVGDALDATARAVALQAAAEEKWKTEWAALEQLQVKEDGR